MFLSVLMPERNGRPRRNVQTLSKAHEVGQIVRVECCNCSIKRHYLPEDLLKLVGDIAFWDIERRMRCERCGLRDHLKAAVILPTPGERAAIRIRRLVEIRTVRKVI
jgi:hypothetical protein